MPEGQDKGHKKIKNLAQSCQSIYFFAARFARLVDYLLIYQHPKIILPAKLSKCLESLLECSAKLLPGHLIQADIIDFPIQL